MWNSLKILWQCKDFPHSWIWPSGPTGVYYWHIQPTTPLFQWFSAYAWPPTPFVSNFQYFPDQPYPLLLLTWFVNGSILAKVIFFHCMHFYFNKQNPAYGRHWISWNLRSSIPNAKNFSCLTVLTGKFVAVDIFWPFLTFTFLVTFWPFTTFEILTLLYFF